MAEINDLNITDASNTARFPENQAPSSVNDGARALEGLIARGLKDIIDGAITTAGTSTAYTVAANRTLTAYYDGLTLCVKWHVASGATPTVNVDSLGAKSLYWPNGTQLTTDDIPINSRAIIQYDGTNFQVLTPSAAISNFARTLLDDATAAAAATTLALGTGDSPQFTAINIGHATDTTVSRSGAGDIAVEGNVVYRAGGTNVPFSDFVQASAASRLVGRGSAAGAGDFQEITLGTGLSMSGTALSAASGLVLLATATASASASVDFTSFITSTYDEYELHIAGLVPATDATDVWLRVSTDGGSTFKTASYEFATLELNNIGATSAASGTAAAQMELNNTAIGNASNESFSAVIKFYTPSSATLEKLFMWDSTYLDAAASPFLRAFGGGKYEGDVNAINAVRILMSSGNIASGFFSLFGVAKS